MRVFSKDLLANNGQKMEVSDWSESTQLDYYFQYLKYREDNFYAIDSTALYSTNNWGSWTNKGSINTSYDVGEFDIWAENYGFALVRQETIEGMTYYKSYAIWYGNNWGNVVNFPTSGKWANCYITNVRATKQGYMLVGFKVKNNEKIGIFIIYYRDTSTQTWKFSDPTELNTNVLLNYLFIKKDKIIIFNNEEITINDDVRVYIGKNGYIVVGSDRATSINDYKTRKIASYDWDNVAYGNGIIVVTSSNGYVTSSNDFGETWTTPECKAGFDISGITFAYNKFFVTGTQIETTEGYIVSRSYTNSTFNGKTFRALESKSIGFSSQNQICYGNNKIYILNNNYDSIEPKSKVSYKVWKPKGE